MLNLIRDSHRVKSHEEREALSLRQLAKTALLPVSESQREWGISGRTNNRSTSPMLGSSIVLYLYICITLLSVYINQKRIQFERPREKRERKEALASPLILWSVSKEGIGSKVQSQ